MSLWIVACFQSDGFMALFEPLRTISKQQAVIGYCVLFDHKATIRPFFKTSLSVYAVGCQRCARMRRSRTAGWWKTLSGWNETLLHGNIGRSEYWLCCSDAERFNEWERLSFSWVFWSAPFASVLLVCSLATRLVIDWRICLVRCLFNILVVHSSSWPSQYLNTTLRTCPKQRLEKCLALSGGCSAKTQRLQTPLLAKYDNSTSSPLVSWA